MYGERHLEGKCYLMTKNSWTGAVAKSKAAEDPSTAGPHRISIELSQDRKIQVGRDRENKTLITLTLEITLAQVMYPQYLSFSLQQYGVKFGQTCGDVIYNFSCSILHRYHRVNREIQSVIIPDKR